MWLRQGSRYIGGTNKGTTWQRPKAKEKENDTATTTTTTTTTTATETNYCNHNNYRLLLIKGGD